MRRFGRLAFAVGAASVFVLIASPGFVTADGEPFASNRIEPRQTNAAAGSSPASVQPMPLPQLGAMPWEVGEMIDPLGGEDGPPPLIAPGTPGAALILLDSDQVSENDESYAAEREAGDELDPMNYGRNSLNTVYHYTDQQVEPGLRKQYPYRTVGWFVFVASNNATYRCSAQLIGKSIIATAGHCVHDGGNRASGWIRSGTFYPAYANGANANYKWATANTLYTTTGWYNTGALDAGYDVALVVLNKKAGTNAEIGVATGTLPFCYLNCLQSYWYNSQLGYPGNFDSGTFLNRAEHLEVSDTRDYVYGTAMGGGSSGGGHITNLGKLNVTSGTAGYWNSRNVLFGVTSWGYTDATLKIGGASSLSGPNNNNSFQSMYNAACTRSRVLHGNSSCSLL